jgi:mono/diheme cytochrome c family protein
MRSWLFAFALCVAAGCGKSTSAEHVGSDPSAAPPIASAGDDASGKAKAIFAQRCTPCHGATGGGDGPASASLNPKPRNFHDTTWQASVTDDHIVKIIKLGGASVGKSAAMPNNPDLMNDPPTVTALKDVVRSFRQ